MTTINAVGNGLSGTTGTGNFVGATSPTLVTPNIGVATATSLTFGGGVLNTYTALTVWTPVFTFATPGNLSVSYGTQAGVYSQIGNLVYATFDLTCTPTFTTASGLVHITGLPLTSNASNLAFGTFFTNGTTFPAGTTSIFCRVDGSVSFITLNSCGSAVSVANWSTTQFPTTVATTIEGTIIYSI